MFGGLRSKITSLFKKEEKIAEDKIKENEIEASVEEPFIEKIAQPFVVEKIVEKKVSVSEENLKKLDEVIKKPFTEKPKIIEKPKAVEQPKAEAREKEFAPKLTLGTKLKQVIVRKAVISEADVEQLLWDFQLELLESDVSVSVADKICESIRQKLVGSEISSRQSISELTNQAIKEAVSEIVIEPDYSFIEKVKSKKPFVIMFVGPNGHGKSTSIGKLSYYLNQNGLTSVLVAADTFRAAAIEQLETIGAKAGTKVIKQQYGSDPAAVAFDGIKHAQAKGIDVVLIDTAGRSELNVNLMEQMKKLVRVANPDMKIYIGEALAGNAAVEEAKKFNDFIGIDGVIMTKTDCDVKGGSILSISYEIGKPILFIGLGQEMSDLKPFSKQWFIGKIFEEE